MGKFMKSAVTTSTETDETSALTTVMEITPDSDVAKKYRVLIADDEPIIREGIRDAIDWITLGMEVVGEAEDGEEALERAADLGVDIVLVDMNMPFLNGIELIRALQQKCPCCRYLIISGHDEFAYAQEAVRLGVEDYILKPVQAEQLYAALERLHQRLTEEHQRTAYVQQAGSSD